MSDYQLHRYWYADGPVAANEHIAYVLAKSRGDAYHILIPFLEKEPNWDRIGPRNVDYCGAFEVVIDDDYALLFDGNEFK